MDFCAGDNIGIFPRGVGRGPWEVLERIREYSSKSLTESSDILNAILGILKAFEEDRFRVRHCLGVPILPQPDYNFHQPSEKPQLPFWKPVMGFVIGLCWTSAVPTSRRPGFPGWSWTGWTASVTWNVSALEGLRTDPDINIDFELNDGRIIDYDSLQNSYNELNRSFALSNHIHISTWTTTIKLFGPCSRGRNKVMYEARLDLEDGGFLHWRFKPTTNKVLPTDLTYIGLHMGHHNIEEQDGKWSVTGPALMVIACFESGMERVAFHWIDKGDSVFFEADGKKK